MADIGEELKGFGVELFAKWLLGGGAALIFTLLCAGIIGGAGRDKKTQQQMQDKAWKKYNQDMKKPWMK